MVCLERKENLAFCGKIFLKAIAMWQTANSDVEDCGIGTIAVFAGLNGCLLNMLTTQLVVKWFST